MRLYWEATQEIQKEFGKIKVRYTADHNAPKMCISSDNKSITFCLHNIRNGKELLGLIDTAKNQLEIGKYAPARV